MDFGSAVHLSVATVIGPRESSEGATLRIAEMSFCLFVVFVVFGFGAYLAVFLRKGAWGGREKERAQSEDHKANKTSVQIHTQMTSPSDEDWRMISSCQI